jgi:hypothetical protein
MIKQPNKKTLAREYLILVSCVLLSIIACLVIISYNSYNKNNLEKNSGVKLRLQSTLDSLNSLLRKSSTIEEEYVRGLFDYNSELVKNESVLGSYKDFRNKLSNDSAYNKNFYDLLGGKNVFGDYEGFWSITWERKDRSLQSNKNLKTIKSNIINVEKDIRNIKNLISDYKSNILSNDEKNSFVLFFTIAVISIAFPLRFFYYSLRWSIKSFHENESTSVPIYEERSEIMVENESYTVESGVLNNDEVDNCADQMTEENNTNKFVDSKPLNQDSNQVKNKNKINLFRKITSSILLIMGIMYTVQILPTLLSKPTTFFSINGYNSIIDILISIGLIGGGLAIWYEGRKTIRSIFIIAGVLSIFQYSQSTDYVFLGIILLLIGLALHIFWQPQNKPVE